MFRADKLTAHITGVALSTALSAAILTGMTSISEAACLPFAANTALPINQNGIVFESATTGVPVKTDGGGGIVLGNPVRVTVASGTTAIAFTYRIGSVPNLVVTANSEAGPVTNTLPGNGPAGPGYFVQVMMGISSLELSTDSPDVGYGNEQAIVGACPIPAP